MNCIHFTGVYLCNISNSIHELFMAKLKSSCGILTGRKYDQIGQLNYSLSFLHLDKHINDIVFNRR